MNDSYNETGKLKSLFLKNEMKRLNHLEEQIDKLHLSLDDADTIVSKIKPLLDELLLERLAHKDAKTIEIYANYIATMIEKSVHKDLPTLRKALQPVISPAISKEIEENKEKMVDALYPIMGNMIAKYVTNAIEEMMQKINTKVESGLSLNTYKRKMKSKISGVSESELLLQESHYAQIGSLFVIDKESALLIAEEHIENQAISDPHMVASMASAIKDFVNDWIVNHQESAEVQLLSYGNATLYIESAGSVYLIAFLHKEPDYEQRREIHEFFSSMVQKYSRFFQHFDGDDNAEEIVAIKQNMHAFLTEQLTDTQPQKKKDNTKMFKYILGILLIGLGIGIAIEIKESYEEYTLEDMLKEQTGYNIEIKMVDDSLLLSGDVKDSKSYFEIQTLLFNKGYESLINHIYVPPDDNAKIQYLEQRLKNMEIKLKKIEQND